MHKDVLTLMDRGLKMGMIRIHVLDERAHGGDPCHIRASRGASTRSLMPTCLIVAPKIEDVLGKETGQMRSLMLRNAELFNLSGLPCSESPGRAKDRARFRSACSWWDGPDEDERVLAAAESAWSALYGPGSHE